MTMDGFLDAWAEDSKEYKPGDQAWYTHFRIGRVAPERYEGSQFPEGDEAQDQFFRQMTPNTGSYDQAVDAAVLGAVMEKVKEMTGNKAIYMTHSQGGGVGWDTPMDNVSAIVAIEPGGVPEAGSEQYNKLLEAKIPIVIYFGDYIDNGPEDIASTGFWQGARDGALKFMESYNADGGDSTVVDLPKEGITGNSHFMFQEKNNDRMIVLSTQLNDWGETSAEHAIALTEYFLEHYNIDPDKVYLHGMSGGGETGSLVMGKRPDLYTAYLMTSSKWDGDLDVLAQARTPVYMAIAENDSYYGSDSLKEAYAKLKALYEKQRSRKRWLRKQP